MKIATKNAQTQSLPTPAEPALQPCCDALVTATSKMSANEAELAAMAIVFNDVCFAYQQDEVLHSLDIAIPERSMVAVVGPNGGGKTTFVKLTLGLLKPSRGQIWVLGNALAGISKQSMRIGYVPQYFNFDAAFPVTAMDVVLMGRVERHTFGSYRKADRQRAEYALEQVNLAHLKHRPIANLSGGERQRVLIAQALVTDPKIMILDEPTANVDTQTEHHIYELLAKLNENMTIVVVSHNLNVVTRHASHVACINRTASLTPMADFSEHDLHALQRGDMAFLQHRQNCHVIDPTEVIEASHKH